MHYLMNGEIGDGEYKLQVPGPPGKCAIYKCITMFDLMQPDRSLETAFLARSNCMLLFHLISVKDLFFTSSSSLF